MRGEPRLPSVYRLVVVASAEEVTETARKLALGGGADGTLVWAGPPETEDSRSDFACALVLEPECPWPAAIQLQYVAMVGMYEALGTLLPPVAALTFQWPGTLLLNGGRIAEVQLEGAVDSERQDGDVEWLVLGAKVNVLGRKPEEFKQLTSLHDEAGEHVTPQDVLESFARHFLHWANRWLDRGFGTVRSTWLWHADITGQTLTVPVAGGELSGTFLDLDDDGRLVVEVDGERRTVALDETPFVVSVV